MSFDRLRSQVLYRDKSTCQICLQKLKQLDIHHIIPRRKKGLDSINNLVAVCPKCHELIELNPTPKRSDSKKMICQLDTEKIIKLKIKAAKEQTTLNDLFNKAVDDLLLKDERGGKK